MKPTLHQLRVLRTVAEEGSISAAAQRLHLTPPTLSIQLSQLAETLGFPLYEISSRKLRLTGAGRDAVAAARQIDDELQLLRQRLAARKGIERGRLSIAAASTAEYILPPLIGQFQKDHPGIQASLTIVPRAQLLKRLEDGLDDAYLMTRPPQSAGVVSESVGLNPLVMVAAPDHPWVQRRDLTADQISGERILVREPGSGTRMWTEDWLRPFGVKLDPALELGSNEAIKQAVMSGHGVAIMSLHAVLLELQVGRLALVGIRELPVPVNWHLIQRQGRQITPAAAAFKKHLNACLPDIDADLCAVLQEHNQTLPDGA
ncbi:LysR substrate-binding domain-containing protein [Wenzhouxiangella limi]|uniref:LysR family transcriptional regulator n=1 Tax=Wenzhouxiangella limi TaxID=2707351 RepID=A0A845UY19_9GAMM|nr:LysR family transcriptional regulator [Wenzhouxiangella limi]